MYEDLIAELVGLGLNRNEALAWIALLQDSDGAGLTGYEVAARSGIPRSAVYTVLRQLEQTGAAFAQGGSPARYFPSDPQRYIEQLRRDSLARLDRVGAALSQLQPRRSPEPIWTLSRYDDILARISALLAGAETSVYLSLWDRELLRLLPDLAPLAGKVHGVLHSPDALTTAPPGFSCWVDSVEGDGGKASWSHKALVVVDRREAFIGSTEPFADNQAVVTRNPSLVDVATNHIILDITLLARRTGRDPQGDVAPMMRPHLGA